MPKPSTRPDWTVGNPNFGTVTVEPTSGKKITGWTPGEPPPCETFNWLFYNLSEWVKYLDGVIPMAYQAIVGTGPGATHATLAAAFADGAVASGSRILQTISETLNATAQCTKNNIQVDCLPGVTFSKGTAGTGLQISANGFKLYGGRFSSFSVAGNKAILIDAGSLYAMIRDVRFASCDTEISDLAPASSILGTLTE